jgi:hypothetical protein
MRAVIRDESSVQEEKESNSEKSTKENSCKLCESNGNVLFKDEEPPHPNCNCEVLDFSKEELIKELETLLNNLISNKDFQDGKVPALTNLKETIDEVRYFLQDLKSSREEIQKDMVEKYQQLASNHQLKQTYLNKLGEIGKLETFAHKVLEEGKRQIQSSLHDIIKESISGSLTTIAQIKSQYSQSFPDIKTSTIFLQAYATMLQANTIGADKLYHALANAKASQLGLEKDATLISNFRELNSIDLKDTEEDQIANAIGREVGKKHPNATEEELVNILKNEYGIDTKGYIPTDWWSILNRSGSKIKQKIYQ